ncbi:Alkaline phosphatase [Thermoflexales bacterium]|nr:Alkaline phosphatase [Thermoflexales bacterium]
MVETVRRCARSAWPGLVVLLFFTGSVTLTRGPYLQSVTATSAIVIWRTDVPGNSRVDYGVGDYTYSIELPDPTLEHVVTLTELITGTEVAYRVSTDGVELASGSFRTATGPAQSFSFAVIGDSGIGSVKQYAVADQMVALDPHFVLHTGDVVYPDGQAQGYDPFFFQPYQALARRAPIFLSLGNHDYHTQRGQPYLDVFYLPHNNPANTERYYSFDWGNAHFTALDFNTGPAVDQLAWLKDDLASTHQLWKIVFYHQAIYSSGPHGHEGWVEAKRQLLAPIFEQQAVDLVINGHDHDYERTLPINDVVYIVSGGGGASVYKVEPQPFSAYAETTHHTAFVTIEGCILTVLAIKPDGTVFDATTLTKACPAPTPEPTLVPTPSLEFEWPVFLPVIWKAQ